MTVQSTGTPAQNASARDGLEANVGGEPALASETASVIESGFASPLAQAIMIEGHHPDIIEFLADLRNNEILTPPKVVNRVLDMLPAEVWEDKGLVWLDPSCKSGSFLREVARRLFDSLREQIPDDQERREHILKEMLFGIGLSELTAMESRRTLYYSKDASGDYSGVRFEGQPEGNIRFERTQHTFVNGRCSVCGDKGSLERGESRENYAYQFIHTPEALKDMKIDVVIGNPPYQLEDEGAGVSATPIYQLFVEQAFRLKPRYVSMIVQSRWFAGGKGLGGFRKRMLRSRHFRNIVDFVNADDLFPDADIAGGVCYFLWDREYSGDCEFIGVRNGVAGAPVMRNLGDYSVLVRYNEAVSILEKVRRKESIFLDSQVSVRKPFGFPTNFTGYRKAPRPGDVQIITRAGRKWISRSAVKVRPELIDKYKVLTANGYGERGDFPYLFMRQPIMAEPGTCCTETYIVCGVYDSEAEADNFAAYMRTRFFRFLLSLLKNTQHITRDRFIFVPALDMTVRWTDEMLYKRYGVTEEEQRFIASIVREMPDEAVIVAPPVKKVP